MRKVHPARRTPAQRSSEPNQEGSVQRRRLAAGRWRCSNLSGRIGGTWMRARSNYAPLYASVAGKSQKAQAMHPSIGWPPPRVGRHLATWNQHTTSSVLYGDLYHITALKG